MKFIFNEDVTIRTQILVSFSAVVVVSVGVTLGICYGLMFSAGHDAYSSASSTITSNTNQNVLSNALDISAAINQQLLIVAESVCQVSSLYSSVLIEEYTTSNPILTSYPSYREYNFNAGCATAGTCPDDYGALPARSRIPSTASVTSGSMMHSSVLAYYNYYGTIRTDSAWDAYITYNSDANQVIEALAYQDMDLRTLYKEGPNSTLFFYVAAELLQYYNTFELQRFISVQRTFPGINAAQYSDPVSETWFSRAPVSGVYVQSPYKEVITQELVITLSSRQQSLSQNGYSVALVSAGVMLVSSLQDMVLSMHIENDGFAALISYSPYSNGDDDPFFKVLVWGNDTDTYSDGSGFKEVSDYAPEFPYDALYSETTLEYTDADGTTWVVASVPFFNSTDHLGYGSTSAFNVLVFQKKSLVETTLPILTANIDDTMNSVTETTLILIGVVIGILLVLIVLMSLYITEPLAKIMSIATQIIDQMGTEELRRDFSACVNDAFFMQNNRGDEVGALTSEFFIVVTMLHNKNVEKKRQPKYPHNPFYLGSFWNNWTKTEEGAGADRPMLTWDMFLDLLHSVGLAPAAPKPVTAPVQSVENAAGELDVLGSLQRKQPRTGASPMEYTSLKTTDTEPPSPQMLKDDGVGFSVLPEHAREVAWYRSIQTKFWALLGTLFVALIAIMCITIATLKNEGENWMSETSADMKSQQIAQLHSLVDSKSVFVKAFILQMTVDIRALTVFATALLNYEITTRNNVISGDYLHSYAQETGNPYAYDAYTSSTKSNDFSSYFYKQEVNCGDSSCYAKYYNAYTTQLSSLLDLKMRSYLYSGTYVSVLQFAFTNTSLIRNYPYSETSSLQTPTSCSVTSQYLPMCANMYKTSACNPAVTSGYYYPYDPRCRAWFWLGALSTGGPNSVIFQNAKLSSAGQYIVTVVTPVYSPYQAFGTDVSTAATSTSFPSAVLNFNILMSRLSDSLNALPILESGYNYLISATNTSIIIVHPSATSSCTTIKCAEGFSSEEWLAFEQQVLIPIQYGYDDVPTTYQKQGKTWHLAHKNVGYGSAQYTLISTVSDSDIMHASRRVSKEITTASVNMIVALVLCLTFVIGLVVYAALLLVRTIVNPINELKSVLTIVTSGNLNCAVPVNSSSYDMRILLDAFVNLMVALRFGSDSYARGRKEDALKAFQDALQLYTLAGNKYGIASAHNNIAAAQLELKQYGEAEKHFLEAIRIGEELIATLVAETPKPPVVTAANAVTTADADAAAKAASIAADHANSIAKMKRTVSDRRGNLVVLRLHQNDFAGAFALLEQLLLSDKADEYIMGCVVKQGILGHFYLKQGELKSAERVFNSALEFIRNKDAAFFGDTWNSVEAQVAEQIALYNVACFFEEQDQFIATSLLLESLTRHPDMHTSTTTKTLRAIHRIFVGQQMVAEAQRVVDLANAHNLEIVSKGGRSHRSAGKKRVAFVLDYSGSMAGSKIRTAMENINAIVSDHISAEDSVMIVHFTNVVHVDFNLNVKGGNETELLRVIGSLLYPTGSTALYDAIHRAATALMTTTSPSASDWIIALTDGEDNSSSMSHEKLIAELANPASNKASVIVIGVGGDVKESVLEPIAKATERGTYIFATSDKTSMDQAFGAAVSVIEGGQIIVED